MNEESQAHGAKSRPPFWKRIDTAPEELSRLAARLRRFTNEQPLMASLAALGAGFLFARIVSRR